MNSLTALRHKLAIDSTLALGIKVMSLPLSCLTSLAMARYWGAKNLGIYTLAIYLVTTLSVICRLGLDTGMLRFGSGLKAAGREGDIAGLFWKGLVLVLFLSVLAALGLFLTRGWLVPFFHAPALPEVLPVLSLALPVTVAAAFCGETLRSLGGVRWVVAQQDFLNPLGLLMLIVVFAWQGQVLTSSPASLGLAFLMSSTLGLGFVAVLLRPYLKESLKPSFTRLGPLLRYSWPLYASVLLMLAFNAADSLVLGFFTGPEQVAYYEAASRTALLVGLPLLAVNAVVPPIFAQMHQTGNLQELERLAQNSTRWMYCVSLPLALFMVALAPDILNLFGADFGEARWALQVLVLAQLVNVACGSVGFLLAMTGNQLTLTTTLSLGGAIGLPLMAVSTAIYGLNGLAAAKGFWLVGANFLMGLGVWRQLGLRVFARGVGWVNISAAVGFGLFWLIRPHLGLWVAVGVGCLVYLALIFRTIFQEVSDIFYQTPWEAIR